MNLEQKATALRELINKSRKLCLFTGAGISVPSGIPDFRSADGIYSKNYKRNLRPEEIISHSFFVRDPEMFYDFYRNKMIYPQAKPNAAHRYFADLEKAGKNVYVVTQNIDGLHQAAGSSGVMELHGSIHRNYCTSCSRYYGGIKCITDADGVPKCECGGIIKPDVVLYEEGLDDNVVSRALDAISTSDLMIVVGTSLAVYPAASFIRYFRGDNLVLINKSSTDYDSSANLVINADIIDVVNLLK